MKHTPGPWKVSDVEYAHAHVIGPRGHIARVTLNDDFNEHDARLVAAAPEMLAALERCIAALRANGAPNCEAVKEAQAAIEKALAKK